MKETSTEMISIIIPVYNVKDYLGDCINSVLNQTYPIYEVLLINDGSNDGSDEVCNFYAKQDPRVKVWHRPNGGAAAARNFGMSKAQGKYITFIDSDDVVHFTYLEKLLRNMTKYNVDLSQISITKLESNHPSLMDSDCAVAPLIKETPLCGETLVHFNGSSCAKLYRREIIRRLDLKFKEDIRLGEDLRFALTYTLCCRKFLFSSEKLYFYRQAVGVTAINQNVANRFSIRDMVQSLEALNGLEQLVQSVTNEGLRTELFDKLLYFQEQHHRFCNRYIDLMPKDKRIAIRRQAKTSLWHIVRNCSYNSQKEFIVMNCQFLRCLYKFLHKTK